MPDRIYPHPMASCPHCGHEITGAYEGPGNSEQRPPRSGDFSVCWGCFGVGVFLVTPFGVALRVATDEELDMLNTDHPTLLSDARRYKRRAGG